MFCIMEGVKGTSEKEKIISRKQAAKKKFKVINEEEKSWKYI